MTDKSKLTRCWWPFPAKTQGNFIHGETGIADLLKPQSRIQKLCLRPSNTKRTLEQFNFSVKKWKPHYRATLIFAVVLVLLAGSSIYVNWRWPDTEICYDLKADAEHLRIAIEGPRPERVTLEGGKFCPETKPNDYDPFIAALVDRGWIEILVSSSFILAFLFGLWQWNTSKAENSFSEAFARKSDINKFIFDNSGPLSGLFDEAIRGGAACHEFKKNMFVFMELDNLEYVYEKYRDAELKDKLALRSCLIFGSRCTSSEFRDRACKLVKSGLYRDEFEGAVKSILNISINYPKVFKGTP